MSSTLRQPGRVEFIRRIRCNIHLMPDCGRGPYRHIASVLGVAAAFGLVGFLLAGCGGGSKQPRAGVTRADPAVGTGPSEPAPAPTISVAAEPHIYGAGGWESAGTGSLKTSLSGTIRRTITVNYSTAPPGSGPCDASAADFVATSGTVTFVPGGVQEKSFTVPLREDQLDECVAEVFVVNISATIGTQVNSPQAEYRIYDDDPPPRASITDVTVQEGNPAGPDLMTDAVVEVSLSTVSALTHSVIVKSADGSAQAGHGDYRLQDVSLDFAPGETKKTSKVEVAKDTAREGDEYFFLNLSSIRNVAGIAKGQGRVTILDDD